LTLSTCAQKLRAAVFAFLRFNQSDARRGRGGSGRRRRVEKIKLRRD